MSKFFDELNSREYRDGFTHTFVSDVLDNSEFWPDDSDEFAELFQACAETTEGAAFILFLVGHKKMSKYFTYMRSELGMTSEDEDDDE